MGIFPKQLFLFCFLAGYLNGNGADILSPEKMAAEFCPAGAHCSFSVRDVASGAEVLSHNSKTNSTPASVQKILVAYLALKNLGPGKSFETKIELEGEIQNGILKGDVIVNSSSDPAFGSEFFGAENSASSIIQKILQKLKEKGIKKMEGCLDIRPEKSALMPNPYALYEDVGNYYGADAGGFMYRDNRFKLYLEGAEKTGVPFKFLRTVPEELGIPRFNIYARSSKTGSRDEAYIFPGKINGEWDVRGSYPAGKKEFFIKGALPSPKEAFLRELKKNLIQNGINLKEIPCGKTGENPGQVIYIHTSPEMEKIVRHTLVQSDNVYAEQLVHILGRANMDSNTGMYSGEKLTLLLNGEGYKIQGEFFDASGLSPLNNLNARDFSLALKNIFSSPTGTILLRCMLGSSKNDAGKIKAYNPKLESRLFIKTGYMKTVSSAGGVLKTHSGKQLVFYFALNNTKRPPDFRGRLGKILAQIADGY